MDIVNAENALDEDISSEGEIDNDNETAEEKIPEVADAKLTTKETYYYKMLDKYFKSQDIKMIVVMKDIVDGNSHISLRMLDWFITRYANKNNTTYSIKMNENERFNVHISYKAQLKSYKKRYFDPFRRRRKFIYRYDTNDKTKFMYTTIGQLNFFRWAFSNEVIKYVEDNYDKILDAMIDSNKEDKIKKQTKKSDSEKSTTTQKSKDSIKVKKTGVIVQARKIQDSNEVKIVLSFD